MIEDIMQASVPKFVVRFNPSHVYHFVSQQAKQDSVRIADLGLGSNAARITAIRSLPDAKPRDKVNQEDQPDQSPDEEQDLEEQHVNLEVAFAYRGLPSGSNTKSKAKNLQ
jgi:hypothetical protein